MSGRYGDSERQGYDRRAPDKPKTISKGLVGTLAAKHSISVDGNNKKGAGGGGLLWIADKAYKMVTGHSFIEQLFKPLLDAVRIIVSEIDSLIANEITELAKEAAKTVEGDVAIEAIGLGPEDPVADVVAAAWTGYRAIKIYKRVKAVISAINKIYTVCNGIKKTVEKVSEAKKQLESILTDNSPWPTAGSLISDVEQRGFDFEKDGSWDPTAGVARVAMLPSAT